MSIKTSRRTAAQLPQPSAGPGAAGDHARRLRQNGGTYPGIAIGGPAPATMPGQFPSPSLRPATTVVALTGSAMPRSRVDAGGTRLRLRALHVMGHGSARIARAAGVDPTTIRDLVRGEATTISVHLRDAITAVYDAWWDKRAPGRTRFERAAATAARKRAIAGNWCAAAALDDDLLDSPGYRPRWGWKPATGTGIAPDLCLRSRTRQENRP
jgi:hypothetical protein